MAPYSHEWLAQSLNVPRAWAHKITPTCLSSDNTKNLRVTISIIHGHKEQYRRIMT